ncbi:MAG: biotin transporter BioY [Treponema sp.]|nr:biotin transporter BioY [Treponema sp.]
MNKINRNRYVFCAVFAALVAVSGFIIIPAGIIPIVLKNLFVVLSGTVLGSFYGAVSIIIFISAGILGAPVFVIPGFGVFSTPLGGYLIGYLLGSLAAGLICGKPKIKEKKVKLLFLIRLTLASLSGFLIILLCGMFYMMRLNSMSFAAAFAAGVAPYIPGDLIKLAASIPLALRLRPIAARYINPDK